MKNKIYVTIVATIALSTILPVNFRGHPIANAEKQDTIRLTNSLKKLGFTAVDTQLQAIHILQTPNVKLFELPQLNSSQDKVKEQVKRWLDGIQPELFTVNQEGLRFIRKFKAYKNSMNYFAEDPRNGNEEVFFRMLKKLKNQNQLSASKIQNEIARIKNLKVELDKSVMDVFKYAHEGINLLDNKAEHTTLISQITNIKEQINIDLDTIKKFPDMITIDAWRIFDSIHKKSNLVLYDGLQDVLSLFEKGQTVSAETFGAVAVKLTDLEDIKKIINQFKKTTTMSQVQLQSLQDIVEQNQKMYELTNSLKLTEIQAMRIIDTKQTIQLFNKNINLQINILIEHQSNINTIERVISTLIQLETQPQLNVQILQKEMQLLESLCVNLEAQIEMFEKIISINPTTYTSIINIVKEQKE